MMNTTANLGTSSAFQNKKLTMSVKEARKLLGKPYSIFNDAEIEGIVTLLSVVAIESVRPLVP